MQRKLKMMHAPPRSLQPHHGTQETAATHVPIRRGANEERGARIHSEGFSVTLKEGNHARMDLEIVGLSEVSQRGKDNDRMISLLCGL